MDQITGKTLLACGYKPGGWFGAAIAAVDRHLPAPAATLRAAGALAHRLNIAPEDADEIANVAAVEKHMVELMRVPTVVAGAVMPDACPAGSAPGHHSGRRRCRGRECDPSRHALGRHLLLDGDLDLPRRRAESGCSMPACGSRISAVAAGRAAQQLRPPADVLSADSQATAFLQERVSAAIEHFATQGDGNHFFFVGRIKSTGDVALVTHHGSRKPGALLYKAGMDGRRKFSRQAVAGDAAA